MRAWRCLKLVSTIAPVRRTMLLDLDPVANSWSNSWLSQNWSIDLTKHSERCEWKAVSVQYIWVLLQGMSKKDCINPFWTLAGCCPSELPDSVFVELIHNLRPTLKLGHEWETGSKGHRTELKDREAGAIQYIWSVSAQPMPSCFSLYAKHSATRSRLDA